MRIAAVTHAAHRVGGAEAYLDVVLPALASRGHAIALCTERPPRAGTAWLGAGRVAAHASDGTDECVRFLASWRPDVAFVHGLASPELEAAIVAQWPTAFFAHTYHGTCISGSKTRSVPSVAPCDRTLGPACLLQYLPRRCGGISPLTMLRSYRLQRERLALLPRYGRVLTLSEHMRGEFVRHGAEPQRVHVLPYFAPEAAPSRTRPPGSPLRLLFAGRMERLKGAHLFLEALARLASLVPGDIVAVLVGDGRCRAPLERHAAAIASRSDRIEVVFRGWLDAAGVAAALQEADLLVVPSVWPEPFGLIGPEAAAAGVPAVAFPVGGITEWLLDGQSGHLAGPGRTAADLAAALARCVSSDAHYRSLSDGGRALAAAHALGGHVAALESHLAAASSGSPALTTGASQ